VLDHQLGDRVQRFLWREVPVRSPLRHYYLVRNACLLYRRPYIPARWKIADGCRLPLKLVYYSLFAAPRLAQLRMMFTGVLHGLLNRGGRYPGSA
jgi:rhamnosyltransferase